MRLAIASGGATSDEILNDLQEAKELLAMIRKAIKTAQSRSSRGSTASSMPIAVDGRSISVDSADLDLSTASAPEAKRPDAGS